MSPSAKGAQSPPPNFRPISVVAKWPTFLPLGRKLALDSSDIVLDGDPAPPPQKGDRAPTIFVPCLLRPNGWMDQDATWYGGRPRPRPHCVRWGPSSPSHKKGHSSPQLLAHVCCAQTAEWIKMPHDVEVGLNPSDIVLHGDPAAPAKRGTAPNFRPMSIVAKRSPTSTTAEHLL